MFKYVHHVHYVVHNRDAMVEYLEKNFGMKPDQLIVNESTGMKDALYDLGQTQMQITEPLIPASGIARHLAKHGPGVYHVAWGIDNIQKAAQDLVAKGNKLKGKEPIAQSPRGYQTLSVDQASSHGLWFQLAEDAQAAKRGAGS